MVVVLVLSDDVKKRSVGFKKAMVRMIIAMAFDLMGLVDRVIFAARQTTSRNPPVDNT